jgi:hypothetical protein
MDFQQPSSCKRCNAPMEFLAYLPRLDKQPAYRIFGCTKCKFNEWIADHATK